MKLTNCIVLLLAVAASVLDAAPSDVKPRGSIILFEIIAIIE